MGPAGPVKVLGLVGWQLRYDLLAVVVIAAVLLPLPDTVDPNDYDAILATAGIVASIFVGFRNMNAYQRWWEARTLWGAVINDSRAMHHALSSVDDGSADMASVLERIRRRQVRYAWQLAAELRGVAPLPGVVDLTEDPPEATTIELLNEQAHDIQGLAASGHIDSPTRLMLMSVNRGLVTSQGGLERIRNQPIPAHYDMFVRGLAWVFALVAFNLLHVATHYVGSIALGLLFMILFIAAERLGYFFERPMSNSVFDLPMYRFCSTSTGNLLGSAQPLAAPRQSDKATVWW
ncbi:bestrophin family ion channel [Mycobacterium sp. CVI_P3]|uniref:Bestrophin family ion channel n=1 Tax=Mycobacterium pinniadriaticum TaxID=2994102 RepID=A0ABT3SBA9_9MYCO|nr:bestrophin family ion channel [Mycobacterium pinniadriaticum]MCX2929781.1 bestrophin family ion channel [Mycobacterium pinniadriaticum]MCX2936205.1 bestrophin family ion channel [Mycobacterium pinniadriaticum]